MKLSVSQRVQHEKYGHGVISEADAEYVVIEFDEHGRKKFLTRIVALQPSDEPPPKRRRSRKAGTKKGAAKKKAKTGKTTKTTKTTKKAKAAKKA